MVTVTVTGQNQNLNCTVQTRIGVSKAEELEKIAQLKIKNLPFLILFLLVWSTITKDQYQAVKLYIDSAIS